MSKVCQVCKKRPHNAKGSCTACYQRERRANDPVYRQAHRDRNRESRLRTKFKIDEQQYKAMSTNQVGVCAICNQPEKTKRLAVDHNWQTGAVRGLLCLQCNTKLGWFEKNRLAIEQYVK